eukprot:8716355-Pyramimonas_sp.AAC.1
MLARIQTNRGCPVMDLGLGHTPTAASSWRSGGRSHPCACSARLRASAGASFLADQLGPQPSVQHCDQEKQVAPHVDAAMRMAMSRVKPGRAAGPS